MNNDICDVAGILVGQAEGEIPFETGVSAIICETPAKAGVCVLGSAPGTRETDILKQSNTVDRIDAICLSGGSAFGLDAAGGIMQALSEGILGKGERGVSVGANKVPIVPAAILFDLPQAGYQKPKTGFLPHRDLGYEAAKTASKMLIQGSVGAGKGALAGKLKGGIGSASATLSAPSGNITIGALMAVNSMGQTTIGDTQHFWAFPFEKSCEFGGLGCPADWPENASDVVLKFDEAIARSNTTIGVIATDANLTAGQCERLAMAAHDGLARAIWPCHTPSDGDCVFAISTGDGEDLSHSDFTQLCALASAVAARSIARGVFHAKASSNSVYRDWQSKFGV